MEYEVCDFRYDEGLRNRVDTQIVPCLTTKGGGGISSIPMLKRRTGMALRIRKLTPKECWRLQGQSDEMFEKAEQVNSNAQLYKQAGNSITVDVLVHLFRELFNQYPNEDKN